MNDKQVMMLACPALQKEIETIMEKEGLHYPIFYVPDELHLTPERLRNYLCDFIPRLVNVDYLLLPMGQCGNGTIGVSSGSTTLVLPRCEDCITLLLSKERLSEVTRPKYSYFFTDSWLDFKSSIVHEYNYTLEKYGKKTTDEIMRTIYGQYKHFCYMDTGCGDFDSTAKKIVPLASLVDMDIQSIDAPFGVLRKMLRLDFDDDFIFVPPGQKVELDMFLKTKDCSKIF